MPQHAARWCLAAIVAFAALLRLYHLDAGLPHTTAVDAFKFVGPALAAAGEGDWQPRDYQYPGLYSNGLALIYMVTGAREVYHTHLIALLVAAFTGVALVGVTFSLARPVAGPFGALVAAALVAVEPGMVTQSRVPAPDLLMTLAMTGALAVVVRRPQGIAIWAGLGALAGLAAGSKLTGLYLLPFVVVSSLLALPPTKRLRFVASRTAVGLATAVTVFVATTPAVLRHCGEYLSRFLLELTVQRGGQVGHVQGGYLDYVLSATPTWEHPWLGTSLLANTGAVFVVAAAAGLTLALSGRHGREGVLLGVFALLYLMLISGPGRLKAYRFLLPILPVLCTVAALAVDRLASRFGTRRRWIVPVVAVVAVAFPLWNSAVYVATSGRPSTNDLARSWAAEHITAGARVFLSPFYVEDLSSLAVTTVRLPEVGSRQYRLPPALGRSAERDLIYHPGLVQDLMRTKVRYVVLNSYFDGAFSSVPENRRFFPRAVAGYDAFRSELERRGSTVFSVRGIASRRPGPDITIVELR